VTIQFSPVSDKSHSLRATGIFAGLRVWSKSVHPKNHQCSPEASYTAPTPFVSSVGNPPTEQDSNCVPCRVFRILFVGDRFISVRWCRYLGVSFSLSRVQAYLFRSEVNRSPFLLVRFPFSNAASPLYSRSGVGRCLSSLVVAGS